MKYWIDTEYDDSGDEIALISLGAVSEDDREFYAISTDFDPAAVKPWVRENVLPHLEPAGSAVWQPNTVIASDFWPLSATKPLNSGV